MTYRPTVSPEEAARMQAWHDEHYDYLKKVSEDGEVFDYLGLTLVVPPHVQVIESTSDVLGSVVAGEARPGERVLDMGTGSGVNAILAAKRGADVVAVDINPYAVEAARANAERNGVADKVAIARSDLFDEVEGRFDLVIFDPPFRWMKPRDWAEASITDEDYRALTAFFAHVREHLAEGGRVLVYFGTTADLGYLEQLIETNGLVGRVVSHRELEKDGHLVEYRAYRIEVADLALPGSTVGA
ncbi:MAG TPA: methyltransferase [Nocardioidaceae bacterium]|nr:methyltransferase [Nocardioidaceae bacterium]